MRERRLAENREWHQANADKKLAYNRQWRDAHPDKVKQHLRAQYTRDRADPVLSLRRRLSAQIADALKRRGMGKGGSSISELLDFTVGQLAAHLERQFTPRMSWGNRGSVWEIDHVLPVASFDIREPGDAAFKAAWALTNLRPLLKAENRAKGARRTLLL